MESHKIIDVTIVKGTVLNPRWKSNMQIITTDYGDFIDNMPGKKFGYGDFKPGYDWKSCIGKTISGIKIFQNSGWKWLNKYHSTSENDEMKKEDITKLVDERVREILIDQQISAKPKNKKILIIGETKVKDKDIKGIAKTYGISSDRLDLHLDFMEIKGFDISKLQYSNKYDCLLIGPIPHKTPNIGNYDSMISMLEKEKGYPPFHKITTQSGELKITKESIKKAFQWIKIHVDK